MEALIAQLFNVFVPIVGAIVREHRAAHGADPTDEEIMATFTANIDKYLAEGAAWRAAHPEP